MRLTCRPHAAPEPPEPVAELYLHKINDTVFVYADTHDGKPHEAVVEIEHDGERYLVTARAQTLAIAEPPSRSFLEAMRPHVERLVHDKAVGRTPRVETTDAIVAAFEAADPGQPEAVRIRMTDKPPADKPKSVRNPFA